MKVKVFVPYNLLKKIKEDVDLWFLAQRVEVEIEECQPLSKRFGTKKMVTSSSFVGKQKKIAGISWVLRNHRGVVLLHSRHSIAHIDNIDEAKLQCILWAINSMASLKLSRVVFGSEATDLIGSVTRPKAWPSFAYQASEIRIALANIDNWSLHSEVSDTNQGAKLIAQSASFGARLHSYVARSYPFWLKETFEHDVAFS